jgi:hypothetical protein
MEKIIYEIASYAFGATIDSELAQEAYDVVQEIEAKNK